MDTTGKDEKTVGGETTGGEITGKATEPSGAKGDNPATAGPGPTHVESTTPENKEGKINPSAPEDSNTTPTSTHAK